MPYKSEAQRRFFHTKEGMKEVGEEKVKEFDEASKGKKLPEKAQTEKDWEGHLSPKGKRK